MFTRRSALLRELCLFALFAGTAGLVEEELYQGPTDGLPYFMSEPTVIKTTENDTVVLPCFVENLGDSRVQWWRGERLLADSSGEAPSFVVERVRMGPDNGLEVAAIIADDAGEYECRVERPSPWEPIVQKHSIQVLYNPTVSLSPPGPVMDVRIGDEVSIMCDAFAFPTPTVSWSHMGNLPEDSSSLSGVRSSRLIFKATSRRLAGLYTCTAQNGVGGPVSATVRLRILHPPEVTVEEERVHATPGLRAELICIVTAEPTAKVVWTRGKHPLPQTSRIIRKVNGDRYSLVFHRVLSDDLTSYTCTATNNLGQDQRTLMLTGVAREAVIKAERMSDENDDDSVKLIWEAESYTPIINYKLEFRRTSGPGGASNWTEVVIPADGQSALVHSKSFMLRGLSPGTRYEAAVHSRNAYGWSLPSQVLAFSTNGGQPNADDAQATDNEHIKSSESNSEEDSKSSEAVELTADHTSSASTASAISSLLLLTIVMTTVSSS
ncbi:protein amalgam-like isoform X2 [Ischnura elegans]|uniref:protein amalgam-like isoform X2 n=1 Tax=Ischnura elegans TaxID=197161 RepID=UPI001ED88076|nr:protein amalgam-like isoform X2 [Ischnura elegans]